MFRIIKDTKYGFKSMFNTKNGHYIRLGDEFMASFPHLIDIGIMGHCDHGRSGLCLKAGIKCYQNGLSCSSENMSLENYKRIIDEIKDKTFQCALGGRGDPDMHENFEEILRYSYENNVIPNFTTSGLGMTPEKANICKKYCGAVAVSMYSRLDHAELAVRRFNKGENRAVYRSIEDIPVLFTKANQNMDCQWDAPKYVINGKTYDWDELHHMCYSEELQEYEVFRIYNEKNRDNNYTFNAVKMLVDAGVTTNIHYVLSNTTIDEAILRLKHNGFPMGISAIIFLLHKPVGLGDQADVLNFDNPKLKEFFELIDGKKYPFQIGFDSCTIPGLLNFCKNINKISLDTCEAGRYSMYITSDMIALPCSFDNEKMKYAFDIKNRTIQEAWDSDEFEKFRKFLRTGCPSCPNHKECMGGCPLEPSIVLCQKKH